MLNEKMLNKIIQCDGLEEMKKIEDNSIDLILCDLPYGTTACKWDSVIPFEPLWEQYNRIIKDHGAIVLTATQPFSSALVMSNIKGFKHEWIWQKEKGIGFQIAKYRPMQEHEHVLVFEKKGKRVNYYPIMEKRDKPYFRKGSAREAMSKTKSKVSPLQKATPQDHLYTHKYPKSIRFFAHDKSKLHPTQKPTALFEYLIRTYSKEGDVVLDNCIGSGTTAVASINTNRNFIGYEMEKEYVDIANERINKAIEEKRKEVKKIV